MAVMTEQDTAYDALRERLRGQRSGEVEVLDVQVRPYDYLLEGYLVETTEVTLVLSDPPAGLDTWPNDNIRELCNLAEDEAARLGITPRAIADVANRPGYDDGYGEEEE